MKLDFQKVRVSMLPGGDRVELVMVGKSHPIQSNPQDTPIAWSVDVTQGQGIEWVKQNLGVEPEVFDPYNRLKK